MRGNCGVVYLCLLRIKFRGACIIHWHRGESSGDQQAEQARCRYAVLTLEYSNLGV